MKFKWSKLVNHKHWALCHSETTKTIVCSKSSSNQLLEKQNSYKGLVKLSARHGKLPNASADVDEASKPVNRMKRHDARSGEHRTGAYKLSGIMSS